MSLYSIVKFLHVSGAIGYFVALGTLLFGLAALRRARRVEHVRVLAELIRRLTPLFNISILLLLAAGLGVIELAQSDQSRKLYVTARTKVVDPALTTLTRA